MKKLFFVLLLFVVAILNSTAQDNDWRYILSSTIPKGGIEAKVFNNLYTQQTGAIVGELTDRATFFTTSVSFLYGLNNRFNAGFDLRFRGVRNASLPDSPFKVLNFENTEAARSGITSFGPKVRFAPFISIPKLSVQSSYAFPIGDNLSGISTPTETKPYIDWDGGTWWTQVFNDFSIGAKFALFTELDFLLEDIGKDRLNRFSTPVTVIFSYFPVKNVTLYGLAGYTPYWQDDFDYFAQAGLGGKYQFSKQFEIELLYTYFTNEYLQFIEGKAATFNIGFRYSRW